MDRGKPMDRGSSSDSGRSASAAAALDVLQSASRLGGYLIVAMVVPMEAGQIGSAESGSPTRRQQALADIAAHSADAVSALASGRIESKALRERRKEALPVPGAASPKTPDRLPRVPRIKAARQVS